MRSFPPGQSVVKILWPPRPAKTGSRLRSTPDRLRAAATAGIASARTVEEVIGVHQKLLGLLLAQQVADIEAGLPPGSRVNVNHLTREDRTALRNALHRATDAVSLVREGMA